MLDIQSALGEALARLKAARQADALVARKALPEARAALEQFEFEDVDPAAKISRHGVGTPVFAGMIAASGIGLFVIPMLYVTFQSLREHRRAVSPRKAAPQRD